MPTEKKLRALQRTFELEEQRALTARREVEEVCEERRKIVSELHAKRDELLESLRSLRSEQRAKALQTGRGGTLAAISQFGRRVEKELAQLNEVIKGKEKELQVAEERLQDADEEVVAARLEKKRVERLLDKREFSERIRDEANKEAIADEMNYFRRRKE